jgi:hypothetical protein
MSWFTAAAVQLVLTSMALGALKNRGVISWVKERGGEGENEIKKTSSPREHWFFRSLFWRLLPKA